MEKVAAVGGGLEEYKGSTPYCTKLGKILHSCNIPPSLGQIPKPSDEIILATKHYGIIFNDDGAIDTEESYEGGKDPPSHLGR